jgi:hypothetical protein
VSKTDNIAGTYRTSANPVDVYVAKIVNGKITNPQSATVNSDGTWSLTGSYSEGELLGIYTKEAGKPAPSYIVYATVSDATSALSPFTSVALSVCFDKASNTIRINGLNGNLPSVLTIYSADGKACGINRLSTGVYNAFGLTKGVYIVRIQGQGFKVIKK